MVSKHWAMGHAWLEGCFHFARCSVWASSSEQQSKLNENGDAWYCSLESNSGINFLQSRAAHTSARFSKKRLLCAVLLLGFSRPPCLVINPWYSMTNHQGLSYAVATITGDISSTWVMDQASRSKKLRVVSSLSASSHLICWERCDKANSKPSLFKVDIQQHVHDLFWYHR